MRELSGWVSGLKNSYGEGAPLPISRLFPRFHTQDRGTDGRIPFFDIGNPLSGFCLAWDHFDAGQDPLILRLRR